VSAAVVGGEEDMAIGVDGKRQRAGEAAVRLEAGRLHSVQSLCGLYTPFSALPRCRRSTSELTFAISRNS
jgi:hypothetical protein